MSTAIFNTIKNQLVKNEINDSKRVLTLQDFYPEKIIVWLTTKQKAFKVTKLNKYIKNGKKCFDIEYKDVLTSCDFLDTAYEIAKAKKEKNIKKGYTSDESIATKFLKLNDIYRYELECPNWSASSEEDGYKQCPFNNKEYEILDKADDCTFELFLQQLGYENYKDFISKHEFDKKELFEIFDEEYKEFLNNLHTQEYENGYTY